VKLSWKFIMQGDEKQRGQRRIREFLRELSRTRKTEISFERNLHRSRPWHFFLRKVFQEQQTHRQIVKFFCRVSFHRKSLYKFYTRTFLDEIIERNLCDCMELIWQDILYCVCLLFGIVNRSTGFFSTKIGVVMSAINDLMIHWRDSQ